MMTLYLFSVLLGGGLLLFSMFGGDADADVELDVDAGDGGGDALRWLSLRTATYFLFVFGGVGAALSATWHGVTAPSVALIAAGAGAGVAALVSALFRYLRRTDSGERGGDERIIGLSGRLTLPFGESGTGKVLLSSASRSLELLARPFDTASGDPSSWTTVIVVEMDHGTALVAPLDPATLADPTHPTNP
jgi:hypothetical protein